MSHQLSPVAQIDWIRKKSRDLDESGGEAQPMEGDLKRFRGIDRKVVDQIEVFAACWNAS